MSQENVTVAMSTQPPDGVGHEERGGSAADRQPADLGPARSGLHFCYARPPER